MGVCGGLWRGSETRVPGEYRTLNGKTLFIDGNELCTAQARHSTGSHGRRDRKPGGG